LTVQEIIGIRQRVDAPRRRWFFSHKADLTVWYDQDGAVLGFQFAYDKSFRESVVVWRRGFGIGEARVDDGEGQNPKQAPVLVEKVRGDPALAREAFLREAEKIPEDIVELVTSALGSARPAERGSLF
jgi:hypothetical protein